MWSVLCHLLLVTMLGKKVVCNPVSNNFNSNIREYSVKEDIDNVTNVRPLQKEESGRYAGFAPIMNPIRFKDIPDNTISSSSYGRGSVQVHHGAYGVHDYDDSSHAYGYGYDYPLDLGHHELHEHHGHHGHGGHYGHGGHGHGGHGHGGHHGYGLHHHKFHDPGLAAKAVLWPIAGIALLGAAAALVSNPVLLQLGVISGRRRRDTEEVSGPDHAIDFSKIAKKLTVDDKDDIVKIKNNFEGKNNIKDGKDNEETAKNVGNIEDNVMRKLPKRMFRDPKREALLYTDKTSQSAIDVTLDASIDNRYFQEDRYVPIRLKVKNN